MALVLTAPMQLAGAAGVEASAGYDSTVLYIDPQDPPNRFGDGALLRLGLDIQGGHRTETLRQTLRVHGEANFAGGTGGTVTDQIRFLALGNYSLDWSPTDDWRVSVGATYSLVQGALLLQTPNDSVARFHQATFGGYTANARVQRGFNDSGRLGLFAGVLGNHTIAIEPGTPRSDMILLRGGLDGSVDLGEHDALGATVVGERLNLAGLTDFVHRVAGYLSWRRAWAETFNTTLNGGIDAIQDQNDPTRAHWNVGPYVSVTATKVFPEARLAVLLMGGSTFTAFNNVRCNASPLATNPGAACSGPAVSSGFGRQTSAGLQILWRPLENNRLNITGFLIGSLGTQAGGTTNVTANVMARWVLTRSTAVFARYTFIFNHIEEPTWYPDIRRHVVMAGLNFTLTAGEADYLEGVIPWDEAETSAAIRSSAAESPSAEAAARDPDASGVDRGDVLDDPLDPADRPQDSPHTDPAPPDPDDPNTPLGAQNDPRYYRGSRVEAETREDPRRRGENRNSGNNNSTNTSNTPTNDRVGGSEGNTPSAPRAPQ